MSLLTSIAIKSKKEVELSLSPYRNNELEPLKLFWILDVSIIFSTIVQNIKIHNHVWILDENNIGAPKMRNNFGAVKLAFSLLI